MHYYKHHIGDFIKDTSCLTNEQIAVYLKMLWMYYTSEKPLTDTCEDIAFAVRSDEKTVSLLLRHFFVKQEDGWHQPRCDRELALFHEKGEKARDSANARWKNADAMRTHSDGNADATKTDANQEPTTKNQEPKEKPSVALANGKAKFLDSAIEVLGYLNQMAGSHYRPVKSNLDKIASRLHEGATVEDCKRVVAAKCRAWKTDPKMSGYLRPETLFGESKFWQYEGESKQASPERKFVA